jgi:hypothetical protein
MEGAAANIVELARVFQRQLGFVVWNMACMYGGAVRGLRGSEEMRRQLADVVADTFKDLTPVIGLVAGQAHNMPVPMPPYPQLGCLISSVICMYSCLAGHLGDAAADGLIAIALKYATTGLPELAGTCSSSRGARRQRGHQAPPPPAAAPPGLPGRPTLSAQEAREAGRPPAREQQMAATLRSLASLAACKPGLKGCEQLKSAAFANVLLEALPACEAELAAAVLQMLEALAGLHRDAPPAGLLLEERTLRHLLDAGGQPVRVAPPPPGLPHQPSLHLCMVAVLATAAEEEATAAAAAAPGAPGAGGARRQGQPQGPKGPQQAPAQQERPSKRARSGAAGSGSSAGSSGAADGSGGGSGGGSLLNQSQVDVAEGSRRCWVSLASESSCSSCPIWRISRPWLGPSELGPAAAAVLRMLALSRPSELFAQQHKRLLQRCLAVVPPLLRQGTGRAREEALRLLLAVHARSTEAGFRQAVQAAPDLTACLAKLFLMLSSAMLDSSAAGWLPTSVAGIEPFSLQATKQQQQQQQQQQAAGAPPAAGAAAAACVAAAPGAPAGGAAAARGVAAAAAAPAFLHKRKQAAAAAAAAAPPPVPEPGLEPEPASMAGRTRGARSRAASSSSSGPAAAAALQRQQQQLRAPVPAPAAALLALQAGVAARRQLQTGLPPLRHQDARLLLLHLEPDLSREQVGQACPAAPAAPAAALLQPCCSPAAALLQPC